MTRSFFAAGLALFLGLALAVAAAADVYEIRVDAAISPPIAQFIGDSVKKASDGRADALLVLLDTPGGLDTAMRAIVKAVMDSSVPVVVYVYPSGARAASAGTIILIAAHVAAMAPGTNVGAAHPVSLGSEKMDKEQMSKAVQDAEAYARSLAAKRGRNVEWAARAVRESVSITATEALSQRVIDVVAPNVDDLLSRIDGKTVEEKDKRLVLSTKGAKVVELEMPLKYRILSFLADPNIAYFLMMIGFYGILFEIYSPGTIFPGVIGGISLILAFYAFQTIPINYAGLALIVLGIIFFVLELKITSYGLLSLAAVVSIAGAAVVSVIFFLGVLSYAIKAQLSKVKTGREGLIGETGIARTDLTPSGRVFVHGELWDAVGEEAIAAGERVRVVAVNGMMLKVKLPARRAGLPGKE